MRRLLFQVVLPFLFCLIPFLAAALVAVVIPGEAMAFFLDNVGSMDKLILSVGTCLFATQMMLCWTSLQWRGTGFNEGPDPWVNNLAQAAEWFPMLGLLGTVGGILQTFASMGGEGVTPATIVQMSPAITATGCGLYMAFVNILPPWIVIMGRQMIMTLAGGRSRPPGETR